MKSISTPSRVNPASGTMNGELGFSLLEVIVALAIMALGFVGVLNLFQSSVRTVALSDQYLKAVSLAQAKFGELELKDFDTETASGEFAQDPKFSWEVSVRPHASPLSNPESNIQLDEVALKVYWQDGKKPRDLELVTLRLQGTSHPGSDSRLLSIFSGGARPPADEPGQDAPQADGSAPQKPGSPKGNSPAPNQNISGAGTGSISGVPQGGNHLSGN